MSHRQVKRVRRAARSVLVTAVSLDLLAIFLAVSRGLRSSPGSRSRRTSRRSRSRVFEQRSSAPSISSVPLRKSSTRSAPRTSANSPDGTISNSLQRIPGVQIRREAGEGSAVNVRGLPQVTTQLNGEEYLGANSITNVQPISAISRRSCSPASMSSRRRPRTS